MELNIHNYEEYFLLYADNELPVQEMRMVEEFVAGNPILKEEFDNIMRTVMTPDTTISLEDKSFLLKGEVGEDEVDTMLQSFMMYHDGELDEKEKNEIESLLNTSPGLKEEFDLIGRAKLIPEDITFPFRNQLYRSKVRTMWWWSAAAGALLIIGIGAGILYLRRSEPVQVVKIERKQVPVKTNELPVPLHPVLLPVFHDQPMARVQSRPKKLPVVQVKHVPANPEIIPREEKPDDQAGNVYMDEGMQNGIAKALLNAEKSINGLLNHDDQTTTNTDKSQYTIQPASYTTGNTRPDNGDDEYNNPPGLLDKTKLGTLIKQTKRIIGRNLFRKKSSE